MFPFVSRAMHERVLVERDVAIGRARDIQSDLQRLCVELARADARATGAEDRSIKAMADARVLMSDAFALSRVASQALFGQQDTADVENPPTIREADRQAAVRIREAGGR